MRLRIATAAVAALAVLPPSADGAAPALDPSFGTGGVSRTVAGTGDASLSAIDIAPNGTILGAGTAKVDEAGSRALVVRWLPDGAVDPGFGIRPFTATPVPDSEMPRVAQSLGLAVAATPSAGAVIGGAAQNSRSQRSGFVASYGSNGELDPSFAGSGHVSYNFVSVTDVLRGAGGTVLSGGTMLGAPGAFWDVRRFTTAGQPDPTFGENGRAAYGFFVEGKQDGLADLEPHGPGIAGVGLAELEQVYSETGTWRRSAMAAQRLDESGKLDPTFGTGGRTYVDFGSARSGASAATATPDGGLVLAGSFEKVREEPVWALLKLDANGDVVPGFGSGGRVVLPLAGRASGIRVEPDGDLLVAGTADGRFTLTRLSATGAPDESFGVFQPFPEPSAATDVEMLADGAAVVSGTTMENGRRVLTLVKLAPTPAAEPDGSGGGDGTTSGGGSGSANGGGASGSAPSSGGGIPTRIVGPLRGLELQMLGRRPDRGALRFRVGWAPGSKGRGELKVHATRRGKKVLVASLRFTISGGSGATLRVPLTATGRRIFAAVRRNGRTPVRATLTATPAP